MARGGITVPGSDYTASQQVPGAGNFEQMSAAPAVETTSLIRQAGKNMEDTALLAQRHVQYIEAEKERERQANTVQTESNKGTMFFGELERRLQSGYTDPATGQYVPPVGSEHYVPRLQEEFEKYKGKALAAYNDQPGVQNALDIGLKRMYDARLIHAFNY